MNLSDAIINDYESLRKEALEKKFLPANLGLAIFLQRGMAAWMKIRAICRPDKLPIPKGSCNTRKMIPDDIKDNLVSLLAGIAMERFGEDALWS